MALDFDQISARLTRLPDDALSAFARQHMSNYSIMSLVANELSRRKGIRDAAALKMAGTPPPVNEQLVASLSSGQAPTQGGAGGMDPATLPENQGLGLLPIKTAYVAEGGIIGYAERGLVDDEDAAKSDKKDEADKKSLVDRGLGLIYGMYDPTRPWQSRLPAYTRPFTAMLSPEQEPGQRQAPEPRQRYGADDFPVLSPESRDVWPSAVAQPRVAPRPAGGIAQLAPQQPPAVDPRQQALKTAEYFMGDLEPRYNQQAVDKFKEQQDAIRKRQEAAHKAYLASIPPDKAGAAAEARYKKDAEADPARRKDAFYMALIEAGLGMMASSSPHAFQGLAEGAMRGLGAYKSSMKELDSLARSRNEALDAIEKARRAEQMGLAKDKLALEKDAIRLEDEFSEKMFNFIENRKGLDAQAKRDMHKSAMEIYVNEKKQREQLQAQREIAAMRAWSDQPDPLKDLDRRILAAELAGNKAEAERLYPIRERFRGVPRGITTDLQMQKRRDEFLDKNRAAKRVYDAVPEYKQLVDDAINQGGTPPGPTPAQERAYTNSLRGISSVNLVPQK